MEYHRVTDSTPVTARGLYDTGDATCGKAALETIKFKWKLWLWTTE
jgi:hypothetical protein